MGKFESAILPQLEKIRARIESGISCAALARELGISLSTLNRCRKQHQVRISGPDSGGIRHQRPE